LLISIDLDKKLKTGNKDIMNSISKRFAVFIAKKILNKVRNRYKRTNKKPMPVILVAGTAGKTSQTLLLAQIFKNNGWSVFTGVDQEGKSLNSVTGLTMVLCGFRIEFDSGFVAFKKLWFFVKSISFWLFQNYSKLNKNTILIHEVGFDHQNESQDYLKIFQKDVDCVIITNLTYEHTGGFFDELNNDIFLRIRSKLPEKWQKIIENSDYDFRLKNIALEQFNLLALTDKYIIPDTLGKIDNKLITNLANQIQEMEVTAHRGQNFELVFQESFSFSPDYLLPLTFAKTGYTTKLVSSFYNLDEDNEIDFKSLVLPNGRFSLIHGVNDSVIVDSTYNADPESVSSFLSMMEEVLITSTNIDGNQLLTTSKEKDLGDPPKFYIVLGEMRELGVTSTQAHSDVLDKILKIGKQWSNYIENIYLLGNEWVKCDDDGIVKIEDQVNFISYKNQLFKVFKRAGDIKSLLTAETIKPNSWIWIKGSQNTIFLEILVKYLLNNPQDSYKLCRNTKSWDKIKEKYE
jgi:UDP-N-acetylmuramyl pentapeptide synthase